NRQDLTVELGDGQTVYDINYLSVYCFAVGVNFGHVPVNLTPQRNPVPPSIPPVRDGPPPPALQAWTRPQVAIIPDGDKPTDLTFALGPPAGAKARAMRSICDNLSTVWYVQGQMTPEIWVQRGKIYRLKAQGGEQHPLYITSEETGGYINKPASEQAVIKNFAGGKGKNVGSKCEFKPIGDRRASDSDSFETFDEFRHFLEEDCAQPRQPGQLTWTPDASTPNTVYYGSFTTFNMGGPIRVCNSIGGSPQDPKCINN
uniref:DM13 domain-containing protein n=1 Tax=Plectus sambesii TaxID=2011161 RepID=A0A914US43_9BILA